MANQYDTNLKLQAIADAIGNSSSSGLIQALEDIADAVAGGGGGGSSTAGLVSDNFSETDTYDLGDYCIHNNTLYVCINAITTPGPWDLSDWQATNAGIQLSSLNSALTPKQDFITGIPAALSGGYAYLTKVGRLVLISYYKAISGTIAGSGFNIGTIPAGYLPLNDTSVQCNTMYGNNYGSYQVSINTNGTITTNMGSNTCSNLIRVMGVYVSNS